MSRFDYSGPLSETVLMADLSFRFPGRELFWDGEAMEVTNDTDANAYARRSYREGWLLQAASGDGLVPPAQPDGTGSAMPTRLSSES